MHALLMIPLLALAVPDRPDPTPREAKSPQELIVGDWLCIEATGNTVHTFRVTPAETLWSLNGLPSPENGLTANIVIDGSKTPATIDFTAKRGGGKYLGIWKVEGDQLTFAINDINNNSRPTEFRAPAQVARFRRIK